MDVIRIGDKLISREKIHRSVDRSYHSGQPAPHSRKWLIRPGLTAHSYPGWKLWERCAKVDG